jgi:hypothetical protein
MAYKIFLVEDLSNATNHIELDTENIDFSAVFSVADVSDISKRKDHMTKEIAFKGTKKNNSAFGSLFHLNKLTDHDTVENKLFFNYNPLKTVDCLIYEDSSILLRGSLRVTKVKIDKYGNIIYQTVITGAVIDFKEILADKKLEDLDFSDLAHTYSYANIKQSWTQATQRYDVTRPANDRFINVPFKKGSGYVYPFIDYGETFRVDYLNQNRHSPFVHLRNFRPAIYVKEYFDRIFSQPDLKGYTYEIKDMTGAKTIENKFNSLIIPSNTEKLIEKNGNNRLKVWRQIAPTNEGTKHFWDKYQGLDSGKKMEIPLELDAGLWGPMFHPLLEWYGNYNGLFRHVMKVKKSFTTDGIVKVHFSRFKNVFDRAPNMKVNIQLCQRDWIDQAHGDFKKADKWEVIASNYFIAPYNQQFTDKIVQFEVGEHRFEEGKQICVRICLEDGAYIVVLALGAEVAEYSIKANETYLVLPKDQVNGTIVQEVEPGDLIRPKAPENVKQMDFVKSIITLFNFYVYSEPTRPKHLIFETHDQYYAFTSIDRLKTNALDWSHKVDFEGGLEVKNNMNLPKKYLFNWKDDSDWVNKDYKDAFNEVYGSFNFSDELGIVDQKKVEVIFSPTPAVEYPSTDRWHPCILQKDGGLKIKPVKSNIRIQYYNGMKSCAKYNIGMDAWVKKANSNDWAWEAEMLEEDIPSYAMCSEYYLPDGINNKIPSDVLQFGIPRRLYYGNTKTHEDTKNIYGHYYTNQITQLSNPNTIFVDAEVALNEVDIANLDLRIPVFIDLGQYGHAYFKVLNVEYSHKNDTAKVQLQKIAI